MSKTRIITLSAAVLIVTALFANNAIQSNAEPAQDAYKRIVPVSGFVLAPAPFVQTIMETGTLTGRRESVLSAEVGGQVERILVDVGDNVRAGQPLMQLDDRILELESERALVALEKARLDFDRVEKLEHEGSISQSDYEGARLNLKGAEVQYEFAKKTYEDATVRAPFAGTIARKMTEIGQMVDRGQPVLYIVDNEQLKLELAVDESRIASIQVGAPVVIFVEALNDSFPAEVSAVGARATNGSRTFPVEVKLAAADGIKAGMFARAFVFAGVDSTSLLVPRAATLPDVGRTVVFLARGDKAEKRAVTVLGMSGDQVAVDGVAAGDTVIVTGNQLLSQGSHLALSLK